MDRVQLTQIFSATPGSAWTQNLLELLNIEIQDTDTLGFFGVSELPPLDDNINPLSSTIFTLLKVI